MYYRLVSSTSKNTNIMIIIQGSSIYRVNSHFKVSYYSYGIIQAKGQEPKWPIYPNEKCGELSEFNGSGILCEGCSPNLSLALGSSQCLFCSKDGHIHVALIIVFITTAIALVFFIKILNLTVSVNSQETVSGFIFYTNVIWINQSVFFPSGDLQVNDIVLYSF